MKKGNVFLVMLIALSLMSFMSSKPAKKLTLKTGTFGTCACDGSSTNQSTFELTLNEDHTFHYVDNSNTAKKVDVKGNWASHKNTIRLTDYPADAQIENKWTITEDGKCIKSVKGMCFTRICNVNACK